jgi:CRP/FNR family transcriptional regulator, cyclic AMP receptor protein
MMLIEGCSIGKRTTAHGVIRRALSGGGLLPGSEGDFAMTHDFTDFALLTKASAEVKSVNAGDVIFSEGEPATDMYVVKSGAVDIRRGNRTLETVEAGGIFGEMALVDGARRSADAIALDDAEVVPVREKEFLFLVSQSPYFALSVMAVMARRLRAMNKLDT